MRRTPLRFATVLATVAAAASPAAAQSWQAIPTLSNVAYTTAGRAYWNNGSQDGTGCNIGFIVTGAAGTGGCGSQRPSNWLPYQGPVMTRAYGNGTDAAPLLFAPGTWSFTQAGRLGGDVAGRDMAWGIFTTDGTSRTIVQTFLAGSSPIPQTVLTLGANWGFFIQLARRDGTDLAGGVVPANNVYSDQAGFLRHFALFTNATTLDAALPISAPNFTPFVMGMEDIACTAAATAPSACKADFDNNDVVLTFAPVPEPSTYALMATGLALMGVVARRRRTT